MSEENNLGASNLCITEDAFEKFQAVAMFEEDEFITLSDIVPPQPMVPDLSSELNEIPYDNEVVLSSTENDDAQHINSTVESSHSKNNVLERPGISKNNASEEHKSIPDNENSENRLGAIEKKNKKLKRGKRKTKLNENNIGYQNNSLNVKEYPESENNAFTDNLAIQDSVLSTTVDKNGVESKTDTLGESKYPRRTRRERIPNTSKYPLISETAYIDTTSTKTSPGKRRGRPKKRSLENETISEPDSTNIDNTPLDSENFSQTETSEPDESSKNVVKKGRRGRSTHTHSNIMASNTDIPLKDTNKTTRRGRKKKCSTTDKVSDSIGDLQKPSEGPDAQILETSFSQLEESKSSLNVSVKEENVMHTHDFDSNSLYSNSEKGPGEQSVKDANSGEDKVEESLCKTEDMDVEIDDDADDICLSKLKYNILNSTDSMEDNITVDIQNSTNENGETSNKRNSKVPLMADFEYNIDKIVKEASLDGQNNVDDNNESLLVEDTSKRSNRRKAKQNFKYDEESDEDPFANVELSDDDEPRSRKKGRYCSDDEYIPGKKRGMTPVTSSDTDSDLNESVQEGRKQKRKVFKSLDGQSPKKRGRKSKKDSLSQFTSPGEDQEEDIEACLQPSLIKPEDEPLSMKPPAEAWATSNEFENFIAQKIQGTNLKIKKVSSKQKTESNVAPLEIPVIDQNEPKKLIEISTQTVSTPTKSTAMQTSVPYDIPMKTNLILSSEQSEKACEFLNSVVKTTVELGQLMKEKSEDFMKKKINTENVTDTFKMDYCVRKSFLLFKLAKHNLMQMEEDLAKQYDEFLKSNNLSSCREELKNVTPKPKAERESDSDCEIVDVKEVTTASIKKEKTNFNPKTVFLNKELSIKIAKKPSADKNVDIKGRHTVWINDSVMVKKVKPTQSFLAQDSRNKKPPDCVTEKMVSDFFKDYYRQKVLAVCAPYISTEWSGICKEYACHYFVKCNEFDESNSKNADISMNMIETNASTSNGNCSDIAHIQETHKNNPKSLSSLCHEVISNCLRVDNIKEVNEDFTCNLADGKVKNQPLTLFRLCIRSLSPELENNMSNKPSILNNEEDKIVSVTVVLPLKSLCYQRVADLIPFKERNNNSMNINERAIVIDTLYQEEVNYKDPNANTIEKNVSQHTNVNRELDILSDESNHCDDGYEHIDDRYVFQDANLLFSSSDKHKNSIKSLLSLCVKTIQNMYGDSNKFINTCFNDGKKLHLIVEDAQFQPKYSTPKSLKCVVYENINKCMYGHELTDFFAEPTSTLCYTEEIFNSNETSEDFTINCINTMSEEAYHNLEAPNEFEDGDDYDYEPDIETFDEDEANENEWASQVQMQELRSCVTPTNNLTSNEFDDTNINNACITSAMNTCENRLDDTNIENDDHCQHVLESTVANSILTNQIKLEPLDVPENVLDSSIVKTEPVHGLDEMTIIPESVISVTKSEMIENGLETGDDVSDKETSAYDVNTFEQFVKTNKMIRSIDENSDSDEIYSQSALRIRRQHEPDYDAENDMNMSLLIPQTYEPLHIENAKGVLMESSSDESRDSSTKKGGKKKIDKRKGKLKKGKEITKNSKEISKEMPAPVKEISVPLKEKGQSINEVAMLTRKMREKIRQEEKKIESSDSETDNISLSLRKDKNKKENEKNKPTKNLKQGESSKDNKEVDNEIQCNNVDSTEQISDIKEKSKKQDQFTGFSAIDQNEMSSYQKYMQFVYDKIVPGDEESITQENTLTDFDETNQDSNRSSSPIINPDHPVELLECEPTMPIFDNENADKPVKRPKKTVSKKNKENKLETLQTSPKKKDELQFTERDGWHLYSIDTTDAKLYQNCQIPLEKLPESFVDTYLEYHDITDRDNIDKEVDRLANLQTLNRAIGIKEGKSKSRQKGKNFNNEQSASEQTSANVSRVASPAHSDRFDELTASEDEGANVDDEVPPPVPLRTTENFIAKNSLMDDNESESDGGGGKKIEEVLNETNQTEVKYQPGPKSKTKLGNKTKVDHLPPSENLMLTADKMMNKELTLLHAPLHLKEEVKDTPAKEPSPKEETKYKKRSARHVSLRDRIKTEDDSSSEEEKQWVSTKEKLLKRMGKKEDIGADDAKRAKLVDDFIERRGDAPSKRRAGGGSNRRSRKKFLERLKQQRVLSKELFGEPCIDLTSGGKRSAATGLFKGRRNIRKVIDKKSLQKSTVLANMEEFERKRRLNAKQNQLRELLGCEEGVNVLVINDEVCLEYDFQEQRPIVTVHPFFTKVMKAHQYEGVKFMWDACFESLASIEAGRAGGGCILAHCMGLGKTLQVLALLHTVLTHPRAGMHRVLVCCPLSTVLNWVDEIHKWIGPVTDQIKVFELSKLKKTYERAYQLEDWYNGGGIFIIGYELFRSLTTLDPLIDEVRPTIINKIRTALLDPGPDIVICDEGHLLKNDCSVLAVAMSRVVTRRRIVLTGTPMQNNLREYYCMVNFVKPNLLGTYSEYSNRFENPIMNGQHRDSLEEDIKLMKARTHILHKVLEGCLQRQEASVLYPYLPKKHEYTVFIPLTKCQWDLYKHYVHHYTKKSKQSVLKDFHILQKIWSHPQVLHNFQIKSQDDAKKKELKAEKLEDDLALEDKEDIKPTDTEVWWLQYLADGAMLNSLDSSNKFVAVFRILHECITLGDKVLIFSTSLFCLDALEYFLREINNWSLGQEYYRLDGSVPAEVRQKWVREFNAENNVKTKLFLISTRAGCLGLNMTAANRVIILDTSWNPAHDIQSIFRVYRFGQKKDCYIYRLVAMGTMEQKIYERSVTKQAVACRVVDEQQIDRHYNMAELTELYKFDEHGSGVAGGVAVGVGDVALLRVARDAAVHAVHEHDSLLRGSGEQGLPEHERAAAWMQFQQEHAHKQMQNDLETDQAARALKKLEALQLIQQQHAQQRAQVVNIKTEDGPVHDLLVPRGMPAMRGRGGFVRGGRGRKIVQCRIPIILNSDQPGTSHGSVMPEEEMVRQISDILIKHNFTETGKGPKQIRELVTKVKRMIQTGKPMSCNDELTSSIASVLLQQQMTAAPPATPIPTTHPLMPALTDIEVTPEEPRRRGRPRKIVQIPRTEEPASPPPEPEEELEVGGRRRRKAAIAAERQFDMSDDAASQDSVAVNQVIEVDDDDWQAASDTDSAPEHIPEPTVPEKTPQLKGKGRKRLVETDAPETSKLDDGDWQAASDTDSSPEHIPKPPAPEKRRELKGKGRKRLVETYAPEKTNQMQLDDASILLSDDEVPFVQPPATAATTATSAATSKADVILHPSLLTNQNFIKIVAHTYLAGNPMLDEDAATLAAQYSTYRLLKETESSGKPIDSGPIYDIAIKVLGKEVLRKLQTADPKSKKDRGDSSAASSKLMLLLGQDAAEPTAPVKKKPGPKSRVQPVNLEKETPKIGVPTTVNLQQTGVGIVPVTLVRRTTTTAAPAPVPPHSTADECILPDDDDDVRCVTEPPPASQPPQPGKPITFKLKLVKKEKDSKLRMSPMETVPIRVTASGGKSFPPAQSASNATATICLDSDEEESPAPAPAPAPTIMRVQRVLRQTTQTQRYSTPAGEGPVPVALTGPNSQPIPLPLGSQQPQQAPPPSQPTYYNFSVAPTTAAYNDPVPVSLTGPDSRPVPISLTGPDSRPVPISLTGPVFQGIPLSLGGPGAQAVPSSFAGSVPLSYASGVQSIPMSFASGTQNIPMTFTVPSSSESGGGMQPVTMSFVGSGRAGSAPQSIALSAVRMSGPDAGGVRTMRLSIPAASAAGGAPSPSGVVHQVSSNVFLVPAGAGDRLLTRVPASQVPPSLQVPTPPPAATPPPQLSPANIPYPISKNKTVCKPGDILRLTKSGQLEVLKSASGEIHTIDDDEPVAAPKLRASTTKVPMEKMTTPKAPIPAAVPQKTPTPKAPAPKAAAPKAPAPKAPAPKAAAPKAPAPKAPAPKAPAPKAPAPKAPAPKAPAPKAPAPKAPTPKPASTGTSLLKPKNDDKERKQRKISSSSSSSSDSSRSPSPDPLSILKDVVHIQAPEKRKSKYDTFTPSAAQISKQPTTTQSNTKIAPKPATAPSNDKDKRKDDHITRKLNSILSGVQKKQTSGGAAINALGKSAQITPKSKSNTGTANIKDSIDLTEIPFKSAKATITPINTSKNNPKGGKLTSSSNKDGPTTVVGTSKNIVLVAKSKSLMNSSTVDLTSPKSVQVTNMKTIPPSATNKQKPPEKKRPAPPPETAAPKQKKTELMTLKDFDIDDIDGIIELD